MSRRVPVLVSLLWALLLALPGPGAAGESVSVAVASSLLPVLRELAAPFREATGHRLALSAGSTGQLRARILQGAPYQVLVAADAETPLLLMRRGRAVPGTLRPVALGRLVAWTPRGDPAAMLRAGGYRRLAVAHPRLAPYGRAAEEALERLEVPRERLVRAPSAGQALLWVAAGGADLALVGAAQVVGRGRAWAVPEGWYDPVRYTAALLRPGRGRAGARAFLAFLGGERARAALIRHGYRPTAPGSMQSVPWEARPKEAVRGG